MGDAKVRSASWTAGSDGGVAITDTSAKRHTGYSGTDDEGSKRRRIDTPKKENARNTSNIDILCLRPVNKARPRAKKESYALDNEEFTRQSFLSQSRNESDKWADTCLEALQVKFGHHMLSPYGVNRK
jgi:hypothetical protein